MSPSALGILYACGAYFFWGVLPLYLKLLQSVNSLEVLAHRIVWSLVLLLGILAIRRHWGWLRGLRQTPRTLRSFVASAMFISINWGVYIWAVNDARTVDASLGYFINPLINVLAGTLLLRERLRSAQWLAVGVATAGVAWLTAASGSVPVVSLVLACSFAAYGLLRKMATLGAVEGLTLETLLLAPAAVGWLVWAGMSGQAAYPQAGPLLWIILLAAGPVTAIPLLLFAAGARRIPLTTLGVLQYIAPTLQFLLGVFAFGEPFDRARLVGFLLIWTALAVFTVEGIWRTQRTARLG